MDVKSFIIGVLAAACLFLLMGQTNVQWGSLQGRYQMEMTQDAWAILDTQTGVARILDKGKRLEMRYE